MTDFERLLKTLVGAGVAFIVVGGFAATAYGSAFITVANTRQVGPKILNESRSWNCSGRNGNLRNKKLVVSRFT